MNIGLECFAGANTCRGFESGFDGLFKNTKKTFFIKGAPGTGKSSLMKRLALRQRALGHTVSIFHCSSDPDSYDGVTDETAGVSIFDATAPHSYDPPCPGATGVILPLGDLLNEKALYSDAAEIERLNAEIRAEFQKASGFLAAVSGIRSAYRKDPDPAAAESFAASLLENVSPARQQGRLFRYFLTAVTHKGVTGFENVFSESMTVHVSSPSPDLVSEALCALLRRAQAAGMDAVAFLNPVDARYTDHVYLPSAHLFVTSDISYPAGRTYELPSRVRKMPPETDSIINALTENAANAMLSAKRLHDALEAYYIPRMDFSNLVKCEARVIEAFDSFG